MTIEEAILINQYGQRVISIETILKKMEGKTTEAKRCFLKDVYALIIQSKILEKDIEKIIIDSGLKETYTPCVLLKKGIHKHIFYKIIGLPNNEMSKVIILLLSAFRVPYERRFLMEKNNSKWWYWDLGDERNVMKVLRRYG